jgi:superfamily I DNA/RNA helicase
MRERQERDIDYAMYECRRILENNRTDAVYSSIIVDEGQDFSSNAYRLLRHIAGEERPNDLFIVGDAHQRIYDRKAVLSQCGISVRGRSSHLRLNYRTTEEIRKCAFAFLKGVSFDNLDGEYEGEERCRSLTHGDSPTIRHFNSVADESSFIISEVKRLAERGVELKNICLVARTHNLLDDYARTFGEAGIKAYEIKRTKSDDRNADGLRIATMHRVKGLEFQHMFIAAVNDQVIPPTKAIKGKDETTRQAAIISEKCLLYVALTRAQKGACITSYGTRSIILPPADE